MNSTNAMSLDLKFRIFRVGKFISDFNVCDDNNVSVVLQDLGLKRGKQCWHLFYIYEFSYLHWCTGYFLKLLKLRNKKVNFIKLSDELATGTKRVKTLFYDSLPIQGTILGDSLYTKACRFHNVLRHLKDFEVKLGKLHQINGKFIQKGVDMRLGIDLVQMSMKKQIDKAILITADSDFEYAVEKAQEAGVKVSLAYFPTSLISSTFLKSVDERISLTDNLLDKCKL